MGWQQTYPNKNITGAVIIHAVLVSAPPHEVALPVHTHQPKEAPLIEFAPLVKKTTVLEQTEQVISNPTPTDYLPIGSVDLAASSTDDWAINTEILPRGYSMRIILKLWISANGRIDHWEFEVEPHNEVLALKALEKIKQAQIQPALLNKMPVPSFRQLEIFISRE